MGSLYYLMGMSIASVSDSRVQNMTATIASCYEHNQPTSHSQLVISLPQHPSDSSCKPWVFTNNLTSTVNPGSNQVVHNHQMQWGPASNADSHQMTVRSFWPLFFCENCFHMINCAFSLDLVIISVVLKSKLLYCYTILVQYH